MADQNHRLFIIIFHMFRLLIAHVLHLNGDCAVTYKLLETRRNVATAAYICAKK